jgi:predicted SAM-dependent methyltransferase
MDIEFGCGENPTKLGFKTCDIRKLPKIDFVCPAWEIDKLINHSSVDNIFSRHFFEHLTFDQGRRTLRAWHNIMKTDAICEMMLPNMDYHIQQWISGKHIEHAQAGFWGWQREGDSDVWDIHKSGYNLYTLQNILTEENFTNIYCVRNKGKHLHVKFSKSI